jgi:hypothetical protein
VVLITDKPIQKKPSADQMSSTKQDLDALKKKLEVLTSVPKKKYGFPVTSA